MQTTSTRTGKLETTPDVPLGSSSSGSLLGKAANASDSITVIRFAKLGHLFQPCSRVLIPPVACSNLTSDSRDFSRARNAMEVNFAAIVQSIGSERCHRTDSTKRDQQKTED